MSDNHQNSPAERQQNYRDQLLKDLRLKPVSWLLTDEEQVYLRQAFVRRFGHALTLAERRKHKAMKANLSTEPKGETQLGLL